MQPGLLKLWQEPPAPSLWQRLKRKLPVAAAAAVFWAAVVFVLFFFTGCQFAQREHPINDRATGAPLYVDAATGKATSEPTDEKGNPRERATLPVGSDTVEQAVDLGKGLAQALPPPAGLIAEILGGGLLAGTALALRAARRRRLEELGLTEELIELAAEDPEVAKKIDERGSSEARRRLADKRARKRRPQAA